MLRTGQLVSWLGTLFLICGEVRGLGDAVVYAVNCGGEAHTDMLGVKYQRDDNKHGTPSEFGKQLLIGKTEVEVRWCQRVTLCLCRPSQSTGPDPLPDGEISHFNIWIRHASPG